MPPTEQARWFSENIQPYEPALRAYLLKRFPTLPDHDDLVQETYVRALRAHEREPVPCARAFLFTTARNAAINLFRRRRSRPHEELSEATALRLLDEPAASAQTVEQEQRHEILVEAILALPERCQSRPRGRAAHGVRSQLPIRVNSTPPRGQFRNSRPARGAPGSQPVRG